MKISTTIAINSNLSIPVKGVSIDQQADLLLTVGRDTKRVLSSIAGFPVHTVAILMEDYGCFLVLERKGASTNGSIIYYEENSLIIPLSDSSAVHSIYHTIVNS